jgi:hypothetical protein
MVNIPGSVSQTQVTHFTFLQKLGNPCGISRGYRVDTRAFGNSFLGTPLQASLNEFYQSMVTGINLALEKVEQLEIADPVSQGHSTDNIHKFWKYLIWHKI